jgi:hypothetical protein
MVKSYTWNEIRTFLKTELRTTKHILTYGTIGSCNIENDIDTIITKKIDSSTEDFYKELHSLFEKLNSYLNKKHNSKLICFTSCEEETILLAKGRPNDLLIQTMIYTSFEQIKRHWLPYMFDDESLDELITQHYTTLLGNSNDLFSKKFPQKLKTDPILLYLTEYCNKINSGYSEKKLLKIMNFNFDYILRKRLDSESRQAKNTSEVKNIFNFICKKLDDLENTPNPPQNL